MIKYMITGLACVGLVGTANADWFGGVTKDPITDKVEGVAMVSDGDTLLSTTFGYVCAVGDPEILAFQNLSYTYDDTRSVTFRIDENEPLVYVFGVTQMSAAYLLRSSHNEASFDALMFEIENAQSRIVVRTDDTIVFSASGAKAHILKAKSACN